MILTSPVKVARDYLQGVFDILRRPALLSRCVVPVIIGLISFLLSITAAFVWRDEIAIFFFGDITGWFGLSLSWILLFFNIFLSGIIAFLSMLLIGSFFIESFIELLLREHSLPLPDHKGIGAMALSIGRAIKSDLIIIIVFAFVGLISLVLSFFPLLSLISLLIGIFIAGYNLIDLPMSLMEISFNNRLSAALNHKIEVLILGGIFSLLLFIPFAGIIFAPLGYYAAVLALVRWRKGG